MSTTCEVDDNTAFTFPEVGDEVVSSTCEVGEATRVVVVVVSTTCEVVSTEVLLGAVDTVTLTSTSSSPRVSDC